MYIHKISYFTWLQRLTIAQAPEVIIFLMIKNIYTLPNNTQGVLLGRGYIFVYYEKKYI